MLLKTSFQEWFLVQMVAKSPSHLEVKSFKVVVSIVSCFLLPSTLLSSYLVSRCHKMFNFQCVCFSSVFVYVCQCFSLNALCQPGCACSITKHFPVYFCPKVKSYDHFDNPSARKLTFWSAQMPCCLPVCQSVGIREKNIYFNT